MLLNMKSKTTKGKTTKENVPFLLLENNNTYGLKKIDGRLL